MTGSEPHPDYWPDEETITRSASNPRPFIEIHQTRYVDADPGDEKFERWGFEISGPKTPDGYSIAYDEVAYMRGDRTEAQMIADLSRIAEKHLLDDRGPFFVLRIYLETGEYRKEIDAMMKQHGQSPLWRRAEAAVTRRLGLERSAIKMRYRMRGENPRFR